MMHEGGRLISIPRRADQWGVARSSAGGAAFRVAKWQIGGRTLAANDGIHHILLAEVIGGEGKPEGAKSPWRDKGWKCAQRRRRHTCTRSLGGREKHWRHYQS